METTICEIAQRHIPYPKIAALEKVEKFFHDQEVVVEEKLDGSNVAIVRNDDGEIYYQSRNQILDPVADRKGLFKGFLDWAEQKREEGAFQHMAWGEALFGETLHNGGKIKYDMTPPFVLFDAFYTINDELSFNGYPDVTTRLNYWANLLNVLTPPILYAGPFNAMPAPEALIGKSTFGDTTMEGIVVKGYAIRRWWTNVEGEYREQVDPILAGKVVTADFKERKAKPTSLKNIENPLTTIANTFVTEARVRKAMLKARERSLDETKAHNVIPLVAKDIHDEDVEDIKELLWKAYWKQIAGEVAKITLATHTKILS